MVNPALLPFTLTEPPQSSKPRHSNPTYDTPRNNDRRDMTPDIAICLAILAAAILLFAWDRVPADVVALGVMLAVIATGLLPADKAFAGFGSDTVIMILGLLIMSAGLIQTGVVEITGRFVFDLAGRNADIFLPVIMVSSPGMASKETG